MPSGRVPPDAFGIVDPPHRRRLVGAFEQPGAKRGPVVFQVRRQGFDAHAVDPRRSLVTLNLRQRLAQIVAFDNRFHAHVRPWPPGFQKQRSPQRLRSLAPRARGLHPLPLRERPVRAGFSAAWPMRELRPTRFLQPFGPSPPGRAPRRLLCPRLTSAPRSRALRRAQSGMPDATQISRGKIDRLPRTPAEFTTPVLDDLGLRGHWPARPAG